jgi:hypothetical protein
LAGTTIAGCSVTGFGVSAQPPMQKASAQMKMVLCIIILEVCVIGANICYFIGFFVVDFWDFGSDRSVPNPDRIQNPESLTLTGFKTLSGLGA